MLTSALLAYDPVAGLLGILPPGLDKILCWEEVSPGRWRRLSLSAIQAWLGTLQDSLVRGAHAVWVARCVAMTAWCSSRSAADKASEVSARSERSASRKRTTGRAARKAASAGPAERRSARLAVRRALAAAPVPPRREPSHLPARDPSMFYSDQEAGHHVRVLSARDRLAVRSPNPVDVVVLAVGVPRISLGLTPHVFTTPWQRCLEPLRTLVRCGY